LAHSRKLSFGLSAHSSAADSGAAPRDDSGTVLTPPQGPAAAGDTTSGPATGGTGDTISARAAMPFASLIAAQACAAGSAIDGAGLAELLAGAPTIEIVRPPSEP